MALVHTKCGDGHHRMRPPGRFCSTLAVVPECISTSLAMPNLQQNQTSDAATAKPQDSDDTGVVANERSNAIGASHILIPRQYRSADRCINVRKWTESPYYQGGPKTGTLKRAKPFGLHLGPSGQIKLYCPQSRQFLLKLSQNT